MVDGASSAGRTNYGGHGCKVREGIQEREKCCIKVCMRERENARCRSRVVVEVKVKGTGWDGRDGSGRVRPAPTAVASAQAGSKRLLPKR